MHQSERMLTLKGNELYRIVNVHKCFHSKYYICFIKNCQAAIFVHCICRISLKCLYICLLLSNAFLLRHHMFCFSTLFERSFFATRIKLLFNINSNIILILFQLHAMIIFSRFAKFICSLQNNLFIGNMFMTRIFFINNL